VVQGEGGGQSEGSNPARTRRAGFDVGPWAWPAYYTLQRQRCALQGRALACTHSWYCVTRRRCRLAPPGRLRHRTSRPGPGLDGDLPPGGEFSQGRSRSCKNGSCAAFGRCEVLPCLVTTGAFRPRFLSPLASPRIQRCVQKVKDSDTRSTLALAPPRTDSNVRWDIHCSEPSVRVT